MKKINRREFMEYFRSTQFDIELTVDDKLEIFTQCLAFIPDDFVKIINKILSDYNQDYIVCKCIPLE
ncbi:MAG: hypothetical protein GF311_10185 [Candidatus Lokiarchaeota archaeon]|nr:hypothetical protein [Candidatus Lokiarchaeota archaeon]